MKCQACLMTHDVELIRTYSYIEPGSKNEVMLKEAYYCPRCKARYIIEQEINDLSKKM